MKNNTFIDKFHPIYLMGFFAILTLPILVIPPYFFPPDFGKTLVFRTIMALLLFLFAFQILFTKSQPTLPNLKKNKIFWALIALLGTYLLATIFSADPQFSLWANPLRGGGFVTFTFYFIFALLAFILFKKQDWEKVFNFSIFIGALVSLVAIFQYYGWLSSIFLATPGRPPSATDPAASNTARCPVVTAPWSATSLPVPAVGVRPVPSVPAVSV